MSKQISNLFNRMAANYGARWSSQFPSTEAAEGMRSEWTSALKNYTAPEINRAMDLARSKYPEFPPNLPEFLNLCRASEQQAAGLRKCRRCGITQERERAEHHRELIGRGNDYFCEEHHPEIQQGINNLRERGKAKGVPANF